MKQVDYLWNIIDTLAQFEIPIKITEFDFNAPDDSTHAEWIEIFYKTMYAHPQMAGVFMWGFWEQIHWRPEGAIFNEDFSSKESAIAYYDLIYRKLWNNSYQLTDLMGQSNFTLFHGIHEINVSYQGELYTTIFESFPIQTGEQSLILNIQLPIIQDDSCILGDVNCDDQINIIDIVTIVQFMFGQIDLNESQFISSDLNLDQTINITDIILIISFILE